MIENSWEYAGKTVDEAVNIALEELGLEREDIHVEVLEEPQKGFLGLGGKEARVRVELIGEWEVLGEEKKKETVYAEKKAKERVAEKEEEEKISASAEKPVQMVKDVLSMFEIEAMVEAREREDSIVIDVWGDDIAILIGKEGNTLDALQYLINVSCRRTGEVEKRIIIDIEGYRKRRKGRAEKKAEQTAKRVLSTGKSAELPPMPPSERKAAHMLLRDMAGIRTESIGEGSERRVVVYPDENGST